MEAIKVAKAMEAVINDMDEDEVNVDILIPH